MRLLLNRPTKGFTLIEFVILLLIIAILAIVININWPGSSLTLGAEATQLATDLRYTQALSMTQGQRYCLKISGGTYQILNSATGSPILLAFGNVTSILGNGISFGSISPSGSAMFVFDGAGIPYYSGSTTCNTANAQAATPLATSGSIPLTAGGQTRTILISAETGRVLVQ
ncbi:MAG: prepilin-type N-terminal cleavage/methylation domain-containing protein [Gammaproteobacteria bacterium]|nr:prepilin-type N-terminal cleavage/methylation domain-containing protein [Gammaproteobacteria bacterium]